jgi:hypothetical protein
MGTLPEDQNTFSITPRSTLFRMKNISDQRFFVNRAVYEIMWKNIVERGRLHDMAHAHFMLDT